MILEIRLSGILFEFRSQTNLNVNRILMKANAFFLHYKSRAIHQYKNKCLQHECNK
jgi:hypothetical protein